VEEVAAPVPPLSLTALQQERSPAWSGMARGERHWGQVEQRAAPGRAAERVASLLAPPVQSVRPVAEPQQWAAADSLAETGRHRTPARSRHCR